MTPTTTSSATWPTNFSARSTLPPGAQATLSPDATPIGEVYRYTLRAAAGLSPGGSPALEDWVVEKKFRSVPGVVDVNAFGGPTKQYQVLIDPVKLKSYGLTLNQVFTALSNGNGNAGGSYVEHGSELYIVRGLGFVQNIADIRAIAVDTRNGTPIRISDLGTVHHRPRNSASAASGAPCPAARTRTTWPKASSSCGAAKTRWKCCKRIAPMAEDINEHYLPAGVKLVTYYDRTDLTERTLHTVRKNMIEGIALVLLVLILFLGLGNCRSALVVARSCRFALLGAFLLLDLRGIPANLISLGAIDFGIIVDSAVVVIENLLRMLEQDRGRIHAARPSWMPSRKWAAPSCFPRRFC